MDHVLGLGRRAGGLRSACRTVLIGLAAGWWLGGAPALAQCEPQWLNGYGGPVEVSATGAFQADEFTLWDPDGPGPEPRRLVVASPLRDRYNASVRGVAFWNGLGWIPIPIGTTGTVHTAIAWDPDGDGPLPEWLVAAGTFSSAGGSPASSIAAWNGSAWLPLGDGLTGTAYALALHDFDGPGPLPAQLVAAGTFTASGSTPLARVAFWDGAAWQPLGDGLNGDVNTLRLWKPDPAGPTLLVAGGAFTGSGATPTPKVAVWDGSAWSALGSLSRPVYDLLAWDFDGPGPAGETLLVTGDFAYEPAYVWSGSEWQPLRNAGQTLLPGNLGTALSVFDFDGPGPMEPQVVAAGRFFARDSWGGFTQVGLARWDGEYWWPMNPYGTSAYTFHHGLCRFDEQGDGNPYLVTIGSPGSMHRWIGGSWGAFQGGLRSDSDVTAILPVPDPVHGGERLIFGGSFWTAGTTRVNLIAEWNGFEFRPFGPGLQDIAPSAGVPARVTSIARWDADGPGPLPPRIVAAGTFARSGGTVLNGIGMWDGAAWQPLATGMNSSIWAVTTWDPDGPGPLPELLIAGGRFTQAGSTPALGVAAWDGISWQPLGDGLSAGDVRCLITWDPDGPGPMPARLFAAGSFRSSGSTFVDGVAEWDGSSWQPLGFGLNDPDVRALTIWDPDGPGPEPEVLVVAGAFSVRDVPGLRNLAGWDGTQWRAITPPLPTWPDGAVTWDPDGPGPLPARLVIKGSFTSIDGVPIRRVAMFSPGDSAWRPLGLGLGHLGSGSQAVQSIATWRPDPNRPSSSQLVFGGAFIGSGDRVSEQFARWVESPTPWIAQHPASAIVPDLGEIALRATPALGYAELPGGLAFQWRRESFPGSGVFVPIADGPGGASPGGGIVSGAAGTLSYTRPVVLRIAGARPSDAARYDAVFLNSCGEAISRLATIQIPVCCVDYRPDGEIDFSDVEAFLAALQAGIPGDCAPGADLNNDGEFDFADIERFISLYNAGC